MGLSRHDPSRGGGIRSAPEQRRTAWCFPNQRSPRSQLLATHRSCQRRRNRTGRDHIGPTDVGVARSAPSPDASAHRERRGPIRARCGAQPEHRRFAKPDRPESVVAAAADRSFRHSAPGPQTRFIRREPPWSLSAADAFRAFASCKARVARRLTHDPAAGGGGGTESVIAWRALDFGLQSMLSFATQTELREQRHAGNTRQPTERR